MATHSSILTWKIPWMVNLEGYSPLRHKESDTTKRLTHTDTHTHILIQKCWICVPCVETATLQKEKRTNLSPIHLFVYLALQYIRISKRSINNSLLCHCLQSKYDVIDVGVLIYTFVSQVIYSAYTEQAEKSQQKKQLIFVLFIS